MPVCDVKSHASFSYNPTRAAGVADVYISGEPCDAISFNERAGAV